MPVISKDLKTGRCTTEFELDEREFYAIGRLCVQWAYLEHGIYAVTAAIANAVNIDTPQDALSTSFKRRLRALRLLVEKCAPAGDKERMLTLISKIANLEQDRHKVVHGMWEVDPADPDRLKASSFRPGYEFEKNYAADRICELGTRISAASFELEYPDGWLAALEESFVKDGEHVSYAHTSRQLRRELKARRNQGQSGSDPAKPQEG